MTKAEISLGTPYYMAPEQWQHANKVDYRCDIWSLGVIMYEMLARQKPFTNPNSASLMYSVIMKKIVPPSVIDPCLCELGKSGRAYLYASSGKRSGQTLPNGKGNGYGIGIGVAALYRSGNDFGQFISDSPKQKQHGIR